MKNRLKNTIKKILSKDFYEDIVIAILRFFIKRSPLKLINKKYAAHHPYQSATTSLVTILAVFGLAGYFLFTNYFSSASAWWNDDWHYRKQLTINSSEVDADLTNFPMLVSITDGDLASKAKTDGDDIVFTLNPGNKLDHEIESFDSSTGELVAWVKIPELDSDDDSSIYMYYGNPTTDNQQNGERVWDENFKLVQHMEETPTVDSSAADSTTNKNEGTFNGTMTSDDQALGKIGGSLDFDGSDDYVEIGADESHEVVDATISGWFKVDSTFNSSSATSQIVMEKYADNSNHFLVVLAGIDYDPADYYGISDGSMVFKIENDPYATEGYRHTWTNQASWTAGQWYHFALITDETDGSNNKIYINGVDDTLTNTGLNGPSHDLDATIRIGGSRSDGEQLSGARYLDGGVDEVKMSDLVRSATWISTEYNNQDDPGAFLSISAEEQGPGPVLYLPFDEGFGTTAHDESSAHNDATITGASWATEDMCKTGKCLQFDGDDYLEIDDDNTLDLSNEMTMEAWVKPTTTDKNNQTIISKQETTDEPTKIFRSVGPGATTAITTGSSNEMTITGTTAIFASSLPTNVGVGDAIQYDDDGDGDIDTNDSIAFITGRISGSELSVQSASGGTPTAVSADTDWSLFRAYTSLYDAAFTGDENDGIDDDLEQFENWSNGKDIVTPDEQWNITCYGDATETRTSDVLIDNWTTDEDNYLKIYTPTESNEVGESQRHNGMWDAGKYNISVTGDDALLVRNEGKIVVEGLQILVNMNAWQHIGIFVDSQDSAADIYISDNIIRATNTGAQDAHSGIEINDADITAYVWNNIIYDFNSGGGVNAGIWAHNGVTYTHGNTIDNCGYGIEAGGTATYVKNNVIQNSSIGFNNSFDSSSTNNITDDDAQDGAFGATHSTGTTDGTTASKLVDSGATFLTDGVQVGSIVQDTSNTQYSYVTAIDSETTLSVNDDYFILGENYSVYTNKYGSVTFENEVGDDFRLDQTDTLAIDQGTNLSADSNLAFVTDIEGQTRIDTNSMTNEHEYDIGADEYVPTRIYRSVGPGSTDALEEGTDNPMTIVGNTATFTEALADNIGVGDAIQYDDDDDGDIDTDDSIAFISKRFSNYKFQIKNSTGGPPTEVSADQDWSLFRAYISLANWESGTENTGIDSDLRAFDAGDRNIVTNGEQWNVACYGDATNTTTTEIDDWTTGINNYLKIFSPTLSGEVGISQRHEGELDTSKFLIDINNMDDFGINIQENYVRIEGIQFDMSDADHAAIEAQATIDPGGSNMYFSHNLIKGTSNSTDSGIFINDADITNVYIWNNFIYDFTYSTSGRGIYIRDVSNAYVFNNTVHNCGIGIGDAGTNTLSLKNNVVQDCDNGFYTDGSFSYAENNVTDDDAEDGAFGETAETGTTTSTSAGKLVDSGQNFLSTIEVGMIVSDPFPNYSYVTAIDSDTQLSVNDDIFTSGEGYTVYTNKYGAVDFVDEAGDDFHIDTIDTVALAKGADLSSDPNLPFNSDIDGDTREGSWSIGADEGTPTKIYRSVGPSNTSALATGADNDLTISGSTAIFDEPLPDRIGVGDAIQYDDDSDGDIDSNDSIVFIHGRTSSTEYTVKTAAGAAPVAVTNDNDWSIFRAYTALNNWRVGTENTGIDSDLRAFDGGNRNIVNNGEQWNVACYGDATDTTPPVLNSWTTSEDNYISVYTPVQTSEVGESQRHKGVWTTGAYTIAIDQASEFGIQVLINHFRIEGLQVFMDDDATSAGVEIQWDSYGSDSEHWVSNNIIKKSSENTSTNDAGIYFRNNANDYVTAVLYAFNNIIYGFENSDDDGIFIRAEDPEITLTAYVFNNTIFDCNSGIYRYATNTPTVIAQNNIIQDCTDGFVGTFDSASDHNISDLAGDAPGSNSKNSTTVSFRDESNDDYRLAMSDTAAKDAGLNLYNDSTLPITTDITGEARPSPQDTITKKQDTNGGMTPAFDVGADQISGIDHDNYSMTLYNDATRITSSDEVFGTYQDDIPANRWTHVSYTRDSTNQYLYINGTKRQTDTMDNFLWGNNGKLYIGANNDEPDNSFVGWIDEIRIYPYARTAGEIRADRAAASSGRAVSRANEGLAASFGGGGDNFMSDGLVAYYKMDETTGTTYTDSSGNNNHGTLTNAQETGTAEIASTTTTVVDADNTDLSTTDDAYNGMLVEITGGSCGITTGTARTISDYTGATRTITVPTVFSAETDACTFLIDHQIGGKFGSGAAFDDLDDNISVPNNDSLQFDGQAFSVSVWVNLTTSWAWEFYTIAQKDDQNYGDQAPWFLYSYGHNLGLRVLDSGSTSREVNKDAGLVAGSLTYVTVTFDPSGEMRLYTNGELQDSLDVSGFTFDNSSSTGPLKIGSLSYADEYYFEGNLDEVRLYNRALGAREVKELYEWAPGPVMHLKMDEKVAGDAQTLYDISGNENNGTSSDGANDSGMDCTKPGKYGSACEFDGVDDYVDVGSNSELNFTENMTISAWIEPYETEMQGYTIVGFDDTNNWYLYQYETALYFRYIDTDTNTQTLDFGSFINEDEMIHLAMTYSDSNHEGKVYLNGVFQSSDSGTQDMRTSSWDDMLVGIHNTSSNDRPFDGTIDDLKMYDYIRSQDQIIEDMNAGHPAGGSPVGSPLAYWKFDRGAGDTAYDEMGSSNGTLDASTGGTNLTETEMWSLDGKQGKALEFDGTDDYVTMASESNFDFERTDPFTISAWLKADSSDSSIQIPIAKTTDYSPFRGLHFITNYSCTTTDPGKIMFSLANSWSSNAICVGSTNDTNIQDDNWHHYLIVYDGSSSSGGVDIYEDGEEVALTIARNSLSDTILNDQAFAVGARSDGAPQYHEVFNGLMDEVRVYSYAMTLSQVKTEFNMGKAQVMGQDPSRDNNGTTVTGEAAKYCIPGDTSPCDAPVGEWTFDEKSGTTAFDTSGQGNDGTLTNGPAWTRGRFGSGLNFDGDDDFVLLSTLPTINAPYTIDLWFYPRSISTDAILFAAPESGSTPELKIEGGGSSGFIRYRTSGGFLVNSATAFTTSDLNKWWHLSVTVDSLTDSSNWKLYLNGIDDTGTKGDEVEAAYDLTAPARIGRTYNNIYEFDGLIDQVRIFDHARTPAQIVWDYNKGGPIAEWRFDEGSGTTVHNEVNETGSSYDGTTINGYTWRDAVDCKKGKCLELDGTNTTRVVADALDNMEQLTACAWFNPNSLTNPDSDSEIVIVTKRRWLLSFYNSGILNFEIQTDGTYPRVQSTSSVGTGSWYHVCGVYYGVGINPKLFLNGVNDSDPQTMGGGNQLDDSTYSFAVGAGSSNDYSGNYDGLVDDIKVFNYPLTAEQVKEVMNQGAVSFQ